MWMVFLTKETLLENLLETLEMVSSGPEFRIWGMSFTLEQFKSSKHASPQCSCDIGFSITRSTIDLSECNENLTIGQLVVSPTMLFENGSIKKLVISQPEQLKKITLPWRLHQIIIDLPKNRTNPKRRFVACEFSSVPPSYSHYPSQAEHYVLIGMAKYCLSLKSLTLKLNNFKGIV